MHCKQGVYQYSQDLDYTSFVIPESHWQIYMNIIKHGSRNPELIQYDEINLFRIENKIPENATIGVSFIHVDTNFDLLCTDEIKTLGGIISYTDYYNYMIN